MLYNMKWKKCQLYCSSNINSKNRAGTMHLDIFVCITQILNLSGKSSDNLIDIRLLYWPYIHAIYLNVLFNVYNVKRIYQDSESIKMYGKNT